MSESKKEFDSISAKTTVTGEIIKANHISSGSLVVASDTIIANEISSGAVVSAPTVVSKAPTSGAIVISQDPRIEGEPTSGGVVVGDFEEIKVILRQKIRDYETKEGDNSFFKDDTREKLKRTEKARELRETLTEETSGQRNYLDKVSEYVNF